MRPIIYRQDRSFWKELDDNLIYYHNSNGYFLYSHLRIKNIKADRTMEYLSMFPKHFGVLNKEIFYLNVFIKTERKTIIAKLDRITLKLRINFRVY